MHDGADAGLKTPSAPRSPGGAGDENVEDPFAGLGVEPSAAPATPSAAEVEAMCVALDILNAGAGELDIDIDDAAMPGPEPIPSRIGADISHEGAHEPGAHGLLDEAADKDQLGAPIPLPDVLPGLLDPVPIPVVVEERLRPSWLADIPDALLKSGNRAEDAFRRLSELQVAARLKYGHDHIKSIITPESILSIRWRGMENFFRPLDKAIQPKKVFTERLADDFTVDGVLDEQLVSLAHAALDEDSLSHEPDIGALMDGEQRRTCAPPLTGAGQEFFRVVHKGPKKILGQPRDQSLGFLPGEVVVIKQPIQSKDLTAAREIFLYSEPADRELDLEQLAPSDGLLSRLILWKTDPEKYYWNASLKPAEGFRKGCMLAIKMLMDADAVEGKSVLNVSGTDVDMVASMNELVRLGVVVHGGTSDGGVTTWALFQKSASSLEIITRVFGPQFALLAKTESTTPSDMSILGLVGALERAGWDHRVWDDSEGTKPPPVDVARGRPKHFYGKPDASTLIFSKFYLQALLAIDRITCSGEIEHYETDAYYKWLISNGVTKKTETSELGGTDGRCECACSAHGGCSQTGSSGRATGYWTWRRGAWCYRGTHSQKECTHDPMGALV